MGSPRGSMACLASGKVGALPMADMLTDMDHGGAEVSYDLSSNTKEKGDQLIYYEDKYKIKGYF